MRGRTPPTATPSQVFQTLLVLQFAFTGAVLIYIIVGEVIRATFADFAGQGFTDFGDGIWLLRVVFAAISLYSLVASHFIFTDERQLAGAIKAPPQVDDLTISGQLQTAYITRLTLTESIAIYGFILYLFNAERLDLYSFCLVSLANLVLIWPRRERWEAAFRNAAMNHQGVSSSPW